MFWILVAWLAMLLVVLIICIFICWYKTVPIPYSQAGAMCKTCFKYLKTAFIAVSKTGFTYLKIAFIAVSKISFKFLKIAFNAIRDNIPPNIGLFNKRSQREPHDRTTQTAGCGNCARLQDQIAELQGRQNRDDFDACIRSVMHEQKVELERNLADANTELARRGRFLRVAEDQANQQRAEILSLRDELRLARDDNNADFRKSLAVQQDLERLRQKNAQLTTANLKQMEHTMSQKKRALTAERELDIWGDKIKTLVYDRNELRQTIDRIHAQRVHLERRADGQRESRIRAEVEIEELQRPRTVLRREPEAMFT
ncbi:hypothetical protein CIB48_g4132 [Xylaria polymorpha]|nr:hypothetical protein CIB48_g4132 [Xylaria polymorpha]